MSLYSRARRGARLLMLLLLVSAPVAAQEVVSVSGVVRDSLSGRPLDAAELIVAGRSVSTDAEGRFELAGVSRDAVAEVRRIGYVPRRMSLAELAGGVALLRAPVLLTSLTVVAPEPANAIGQGTQLGLASTPGARIAESGATSLAEAMVGTEGISASSPGPWGGKAFLRGLGAERVAVLLDGNRLNRACNVGMDAGLATLAPENVERVEILAGPGSTLYGSGNVGGVINVVTRGPEGDRQWEGELRAGGSTAVPGGKLGGTLWFRRGELAVVAAADGASYGDYSAPTGSVAGSSFTDAIFDVRADYGRTGPHRGSVRVQRYVGRDIGYPGMNAVIPEEDRLLVAADYAWQGGGGLVEGVSAKLYRQGLDHHMQVEMSNAMMRSSTDARSNSVTLGGRAQARLHPVAGLRVDAGVEATEWRAEGTRWTDRTMTSGMTLPTLTLRSWPDVRVLDAGTFAQAELPVTAALTASAGARLDYIRNRAEDRPRTHEWVGSGNAGLRAELGRGFFARSSLGLGYRVPDPTELFGQVLRPDGFLYVGNPELDTETSRNLELGLGYAAAGVSLSATAFHNRVSGLISPTLSPGDTILGLPVREYRNVSRARLMGVTATATVPVLDWLDLRGTAGYTEGEDLDLGQPLPLVPPFEATFAARTRPARSLWVEPEVRVAAAQDRPALGEVATPGFAVVNLRTGLVLGRTDLVLGVDNVLDRSYRNHLDAVRILAPGRNLYARVTQRF
jgi:outer membrane receptor protein involved in Fe transport